MKHSHVSLVFTLLLLAASHSLNAVLPYFQIRSQSEDTARELVGWAHKVNLYDPECTYGALALTVEYTQSFDQDKITEKLFGKDLIGCDCPFIKISGSQAPNRAPTDWLADYFGLPTDFESVLTFKPKIENIIINLSAYVGLDNILNGLYIRGHAPIVNTRWDLDFCEQICNSGSNGYLAGYYGPAAINRGCLLCNFTQYVSREETPAICPVIFQPLINAKFSSKKRDLTRLADLRGGIGWNFLQGDDHHFGLAIRMAAPTGNRPDGEYLFEPIVGNGHHWELGLGVTAHYRLWVSKDCNESVGVYLDGNVTHLFGARQRRTFDLVNRPFSRYMLVEVLGTPVENLYGSNTGVANATAPLAQFKNVFTPLANVTTFDVDVSIGGQADISLMLNYLHCNTSFDIGYNFWGISCDKIRYKCGCPPPFQANMSNALKGDSFVYGFVAEDAMPLGDLQPGDPVALSATQNRATIHAGRNWPLPTCPPNPNPDNPLQNPGIDNAQFAFFDTDDDSQQLVSQPGQNGGMNTQQRTSIQPRFICPADVDLCAARSKGISQKLFTHVSYTWDTCNYWKPYLGIGGKVELARNNLNDCFADFADDSCQDAAISEWGIWIKGGFSFE